MLRPYVVGTLVMSDLAISRRRFLQSAAATVAAFSVVPRHVLGGRAHKSPSETITRGTVGTGSMGMSHIVENQDGRPPAQLAVCDVDKTRLARALQKAGAGCRACRDFRRVLDRTDIDVIHIATPPHWHALITMAAMRAGKDVYCEKPMTRFIREGRAVVDAARRYGRIVMHNTYGRGGQWRKVRKLVTSGLLGAPLHVYMGPATGYGFKVRNWSGKRHLVPQPVPPELDYRMWLGPAPAKPYHPHRVHGSFRGYWDYDGGGLTDMGQHWIDPIQYVLGKDHTGPVRVETHAPRPAHPEACGLWGRIRLTYADATTITLESGEWGEVRQGRVPFIEGPKGVVFRDPKRRNLTAEPDGLFRRLAGYVEPPEMIGFAEAVKTRSRAPGHKPNAKEGHRSVTLLHLANISIRMGRTIRWDPEAERIVGDDQANRLVDVPMRAPWHL